MTEGQNKEITTKEEIKELKEEKKKEEKTEKKTEKKEVPEAEKPTIKEEKPEKEVKDSKDHKISVLFKRKPIRILLALLQDKKWYPSLLAKESDLSYVHTSKLIDLLEEIDLVSSEFKGKTKVIRLTEKGEKLARSLEEITKNL